MLDRGAPRPQFGEEYRFEERGMVMIKGKGRMLVYFLTGRAETADNSTPAAA
jgi:hypothetical protein